MMMTIMMNDDVYENDHMILNLMMTMMWAILIFDNTF